MSSLHFSDLKERSTRGTAKKIFTAREEKEFQLYMVMKRMAGRWEIQHKNDEWNVLEIYVHIFENSQVANGEKKNW